jgi:hypothetical protein
MEGLASEAAVPKTVMIDATYLKAHRTAMGWGWDRGEVLGGSLRQVTKSASLVLGWPSDENSCPVSR